MRYLYYVNQRIALRVIGFIIVGDASKSCWLNKIFKFTILFIRIIKMFFDYCDLGKNKLKEVVINKGIV